MIGVYWHDVEWVSLAVMNGDLWKHVVYNYWATRWEPIEDEL
jgi:hypothetical protein